MGEALVTDVIPRAPRQAFPIAQREEMLAEVNERLGNGESLTDICGSIPELSFSTFFRWVNADPDAWENYMRAREVQAHQYAARAMDEALSATDAAIGKLRLDALKWAAGKLAPKHYGDSTQLKLADANGDKLNTAPLVAEMLGLMGASGDAPAPPIDVTPRVVERQAEPITQSESPSEPAPMAKAPAKAPAKAYRPRVKRTAPDGIDDLV